MSSRGGARASGTDGTDFQHRQRIAAHYQESASYKTTLKWFFVPHALILVFMWLKVGSQLLKENFGYRSAFFERLDLPEAALWEYMWCFSFIPPVLALMSFPRNKVKLNDAHYYAQFFTGILPCVAGFASQITELHDYISNENSNTATFRGTFPMVIIWYIFFAVALQIHCFCMYFSYLLSSAWTPVQRLHKD